MMNKKPTMRLLSLAGIGLLVVLVDQITKHQVRAALPPGASWNPIPWLEPIVTLTHLRNTGAAFGLFPGLSTVFVLVAIATVLGIALYARQLAEEAPLLHVALGLQLGGAVGNLIDRLARGFVTDFIDVRIWPVFNVADSAVVIGAAVLAFYALFAQPAASRAAAKTPEITDPGGASCE